MTASRRKVRAIASGVAIVALLSLAGLLTAPQPAHAMGDNPSTCNNRYGEVVTSFILYYPGGSLDVLAHQNSTVTMPVDARYNVSFIVHTNSQSVNGNTLGGTTWYSTSWPGYADDACYPSRTGNSVGPNQDVNITLNGLERPGTLSPNGGVRSVYFSFDIPTSSYAVFNIDWKSQNAGPPTSVLSVTSQDTSGKILTGYMAVLNYSGTTTIVATGPTPHTFTLNNSQSYTVGVDGYLSCNFDHWLDTGNTTEIRTISITQNTQVTAVMNCNGALTSTTSSTSVTSSSSVSSQVVSSTVSSTSSSPSAAGTTTGAVTKSSPSTLPGASASTTASPESRSTGVSPSYSSPNGTASTESTSQPGLTPLPVVGTLGALLIIAAGVVILWLRRL